MQYFSTNYSRRYSVALYLLSLLLLASCEPERFSKEQPFAVKVHSYRQPATAQQVAERLEAMGLEPYLQAYNPPGEGRWYAVYLGAFAELEEMIQQKMIYEDEFGLQQIARSNFHQVASVAMPFPEEYPSTISRKAPLPTLPEPLPSLLQSMPDIPNMQVESFQLLWLSKEPDVLGIREISRLKIDFPRGVTPRQLYQSAEGLCMVAYKDEITGRATQLIAIKLREDHPFGEEPANRFSESILGTRRYELEKTEPNSSANDSGYTVSIAPRPGQMKNYLVLYSPEANVLYLGESREKQYSLNDWQTLADKIAPDADLWKRSEVLQTLLSPLPRNFETLAYFKGGRVPLDAPKTSGWLSGNLEGEAIFIGGSPKQHWDAQLHAFASEENTTAYYRGQANEDYRNYRSDSLQIGSIPAQVLSRKRRIGWRKYSYTPQRIIAKVSELHSVDCDFASLELEEEAMKARVMGFVKSKGGRPQDPAVKPRPVTLHPLTDDGMSRAGVLGIFCRLNKLLGQSLFYFFGRILQDDGRSHLQARIFDDPGGFFCIGALQAHNDRDIDASNRLVSLNHAIRHAVATHDTAEDVD